jgi:hypothetical protein
MRANRVWSQEPATDRTEGITQENYWRDDHHEFLRVTFISPDGTLIQEMGSHDFPAPLNRDARSPVQARFEIVHVDGCSRVLDQYPVRVYT